MTLLFLAYQSLKNRIVATTITLFSISLSVFLVLGVERIRVGAKEGFANTLSQTDLVVGARGSDIQLLLYTVFHMGDATNNISVASYETFKYHSAVEWTIPISLGDSHKGHRVIASNENLYKHYRYQGDKFLKFLKGVPAQDVFDVVIGAEVAKKLHYTIGSPIILSHGISEISLVKHNDKPFQIVGILEPTATPIDRALFITLEGMEAIHMDWKDGAPPLTPPLNGEETPASKIKKDSLKPKQITSFLLRTKNRIETLRLQREINTFDNEPLMAAIPGVVLSKLWTTLGIAEKALKGISTCVALVSLLGLLLVVYSSLNERRREMAILRALGLSPFKILFLFLFESLTLVISGSFLGISFLYSFIFFARPWIMNRFGIFLPLQTLTTNEMYFLGLILAAALSVGFIPAYAAYRKSLMDGLTPKT
jgi:putative ABC transport system permease protein